MNLKEAAARWLCKNRRKWPCRFIGQMAFLISRAYENRDFSMATNGEAWCLKRLRDGGIKLRCAFDVGANVGEWVQLCRTNHPETVIHAFEIAAPTFVALKRNVGTLPNVLINPFGLSTSEEEIDLFVPRDEKEIARTTFYKDHLDSAFAVPGQESTLFYTLRGKAISGDEYVQSNKLQMIDFLKIDVEGMEESVLNGLSKTFAEGRIRIIQFEYNTTNIVSKFLLRNAYEFFNGYGYAVGKLYPNYVEFRDYHYYHEDFCGPNFVAVRKEDHDLLKLLGR